MTIHGLNRSALIAALIAGLGCGPALGSEPEAHPLVPGFERFSDRGDSRTGTADREGGLLLLGDLGCLNCHPIERDGDGAGEVIRPKSAPILDGIGGRVRADWLGRFINDPIGVKPGTTMPRLSWEPEAGDRASDVEAIAAFLASTAAEGPIDSAVMPKGIAEGSDLYHQVGCVACHGPIGEEGDQTLPDAVPLGDLAAKYTVGSLAGFLSDPLRHRPSGRMPSLNLSTEEAGAIAQFLLRDLRGIIPMNVRYAYYEGRWSELPDFDTLEPQATGKTIGFGLYAAERPNNVALRFSTFLHLKQDGDYTFSIRSDDGSRLQVDDRLVVDNDGVHGIQERQGTVHLDAGPHRLVVAYFNAEGGSALEVEIEGPDLPRRPAETLVSLSEQPEPPEPEEKAPTSSTDGSLIARGRSLFTTIGCASCHRLSIDGAAPLASTHQGPDLLGVDPAAGCLAESPPVGLPHYGLDEAQRDALTAAIRWLQQGPPAPSPERTIVRTLTTFNCYACHHRGDLGGVEPSRNAFFQTTQPEMGDEGRIPPHLDGVGAKLTADWLGHVLAEGADARPYMLTRMPRFGASNVGALRDLFAAVDQVEPVPVPDFDEPIGRIKAAGHFLVGGQALSCIKCHTFNGVEASGVQSIDMTVMTRRLRRDWFHRYLFDPQSYRPGTRMPDSWPDGQAIVKDVLGGDPDRQIEAIWRYLSDGPEANEPYGLRGDPIPLRPTDEAILYRNFIEGAGNRAIGVGYPEGVNLAFDADAMRIALVWHGDFIDASRHWVGRGSGRQPPLGGNILAMPDGPSLAILESDDAPWPTAPGRAPGYDFQGYRLDSRRRPTFRYEFEGVRVRDEARPEGKGRYPTLRRTLTLESDHSPENIWFRAAVGRTIERQSDGTYLVDGQWRTRLSGPSPPVLRASRGRTELLMPVEWNDGKTSIAQEIIW